MKIKEWDASVFKNPRSFVHDYYTLAAHIRIAPQLLSYCKHEKDNLVKRYKIKDRTVYESTGVLKLVQGKVRPLIKELMFEDCLSHVYSYKPGLCGVDMTKKLTGYDYIVHFDIKKYFDNITVKHIAKALSYFGYSFEGGKLIAQLSTVKHKGRYTLQQGGVNSGEISNLVGYVFIDKKIMKFLESLREENPQTEFVYYRYCDNVYLGVKGSTGVTTLNDYEKGCVKICKEANFRTHKWSKTASTHPKKAQLVLNCVVNEEARVAKRKYIRLRAMLFNCCRSPLRNELNKYYEKNPVEINNIFTNSNNQYEFKKDKFFQVTQGKVNYINQVSKKQGLELKKLLSATKVLEMYSDVNEVYLLGKLNSDVFKAVSKYKRSCESLADYEKRIINIVEMIKNESSVNAA